MLLKKILNPVCVAGFGPVAFCSPVQYNPPPPPHPPHIHTDTIRNQNSLSNSDIKFCRHIQVWSCAIKFLHQIRDENTPSSYRPRFPHLIQTSALSKAESPYFNKINIKPLSSGKTTISMSVCITFIIVCSVSVLQLVIETYKRKLCLEFEAPASVNCAI